MNARSYLVAVVCVIALGMVGCTTSAPGTPSPARVESSTPNRTGASESSVPRSADDTYGAPQVENPLDASRFLTDPCAVLTPAQLTSFGVSTPGRSDTDSEIAKAAGPICTWTADTEISSVIGVTWQSGKGTGLAGLYQLRDRWEYFEETTVEGYPAVFNDSIDNRDAGDCYITVGISDTLTFNASETGTLDANGACARAERVAAAAIVTIKENQ